MALSQISWQDVQQLPDDGNRYEAIAGELYVTAAPSYRHQRISMRLERALYRLVEDATLGQVTHAPVGVEFPGTGEGVQPDIVVVSRGRSGILADPWIRGAPDLVIEILSPTTAGRDRGVKRKLYERQGVEQYWIVDPVAEAVEVWSFGAQLDKRPRFERFTKTLPLHLAGELLGEIDLVEVFRTD
jgi:Uma2 family endonuclease